MKENENKLSTIVRAPADFCFNYCVNPQNTPFWMREIYEEISSEFPPKLGTKYFNRASKTDPWDQFKVNKLVKNKSFGLKCPGYNCEYTFKMLTTSAKRGLFNKKQNQNIEVTVLEFKEYGAGVEEPYPQELIEFLGLKIEEEWIKKQIIIKNFQLDNVM